MQYDILSNTVSISFSVLAGSVSKTFSCTHTAAPFITVDWSRAELRLNAPSAPALILNVSNKNDS